MQLMRTPQRNRQRGFTMVEMIAGAAVMATLLGAGLVLLTRSDDQATGRGKADGVASFEQLASQYFLANRTDIEAAMAGDASKQAIHCLVNVAADGTGGSVAANNTKHTCAFDSTLLRKKQAWPSSADVNAAGNLRNVAIARQVLDGGGTPTGADEMLIVMAPLSSGSVMTTGTFTFTGNTKRAVEELEASKAALGATGGFVPPGADYGPCQYNITTKQACGSSWKVTLSDFIN